MMNGRFLSGTLLAVVVIVSANAADETLSNSDQAPTQSTTAATATTPVPTPATESDATPASVPATIAPQTKDTSKPTGTTNPSADRKTSTIKPPKKPSVDGGDQQLKPLPAGDPAAKDWEELAGRKVRFTPDAVGQHGVQVLWTADSTKAAIEKTFGKDTLEGTPAAGQWASLKSSNLAPWVRDALRALDAQSAELAKATANLTSKTNQLQAAEKKLSERSSLPDLLVYLALAVTAVAIGVAVWVGFTNRKKLEDYERLRAPLGKQDVTLKELIEIIVTAVNDAPYQFTEFRQEVANEAGIGSGPLKPKTSKLNLETWVRWMAVLRDRELKELWVARAILECHNDRRGLDRFVKETVRLDTELHRLLFKAPQQDSDTRWSSVVKNLTEIVDPGPSAHAAARSRSVLQDVERARETGETLKAAIEAVKLLLTACDVADDHVDVVDGPKLINLAAQTAQGVHLVLSTARQIAGKDLTNLDRLAEALDERMRQLKDAAKHCGVQLATAQTQVEDANAALKSAQALQQGDAEKAGRYQALAKELANSLELVTSPEAAVDDQLYPTEFLCGSDWTFRLVLLAARDAWRSSAKEISPALASLLGIDAIPEQFSRSLELLNDLQSRTKAGDHPGPQSADPGGLEVLWRTVDALTRIVEFDRVYQLTELDPLEPLALVVTTMARTFLADRGVELRRPRLLQVPGSDFGKFRPNHRNEGLRAFPGIEKRILEELEKGLDGFIVDVTQSEVRIGGSIQRVGVLSLVSPQQWPPVTTGP